MKQDVTNYILRNPEYQQLLNSIRINLIDDNVGDGKFLSNILVVNKVSL